MPLTNAQFPNQLDPNLPSATDPVADGDDFIRQLHRVLKATFPNISEAITATAAQLNNPFPIGAVVGWSGAVSAIPTGWHLCDGTTVPRSDGAGNIICPDLRGKFTIGAGGDLAVGATGGTVSPAVAISPAGGHTHSASTDAQGQHSHYGVTQGRALTVEQLPPHSHPTVVANAYAGGSGAGLATSSFRLDLNNSSTGQTGSGAAHDHAITADGNHAHAVSVSAVGDHVHAASIADARPPFYALCKIIKV